MSEPEPVMEKRTIRMPDGRSLVFYDFPEPARRPDAGPARDPRAPDDRPRRGEER